MKRKPMAVCIYQLRTDSSLCRRCHVLGEAVQHFLAAAAVRCPQTRCETHACSELFLSWFTLLDLHLPGPHLSPKLSSLPGASRWQFKRMTCFSSFPSLSPGALLQGLSSCPAVGLPFLILPTGGACDSACRFQSSGCSGQLLLLPAQHPSPPLSGNSTSIFLWGANSLPLPIPSVGRTDPNPSSQGRHLTWA